MEPEHHQTKRGDGGDETDLQKPPAPPRLCANNCGFFGSPATNNLCSKCYRQAYLLHAGSSSSQGKQQAASVGLGAVDTLNSVPHGGGDATGTKEVTSCNLSSPSSPPLAAATTAAPATTNPNRCACCRKKVGLMGFWCRCGGVFCPVHRYSDKHACAFDYKAAAQDAIARANPVLKPDKLDKI